MVESIRMSSGRPALGLSLAIGACGGGLCPPFLRRDWCTAWPPPPRPGDPYRQWLQRRGAPPAGRLYIGGVRLGPAPTPPPWTGAGHFLRGAMAAPGGRGEAGPPCCCTGEGAVGPPARALGARGSGGAVSDLGLVGGCPGRGWRALRSETEGEDSPCSNHLRAGVTAASRLSGSAGEDQPHRHPGGAPREPRPLAYGGPKLFGWDLTINAEICSAV